MSQVVKNTLVLATLLAIAAVAHAEVGEPRDAEWFAFFSLMVLVFGLINFLRWRRAQLDPSAQNRSMQQPQ